VDPKTGVRDAARSINGDAFPIIPRGLLRVGTAYWTNWSDRKIGAYLFGASMAAHLVYLSQYARSPFFWAPQLDPLYHDLLAQQIAAGHPPVTAFFRAPFYYYALALVYRLFGHSYWAARVIQAAIGSASCVLTHRLGKAVFGPAAGLIAGCAMVLYGPLVFADGELHTPVLEVFLDLALLCLALAAYRSGNRWMWLATGLVLGVSAIVRPNILVGCAPVLWLIAADVRWARSVRATCAAVFLAGAMFAPGLVTLRNVVVARDPVFIAAQGGINFYLGNRPGADGFNPSTPTRYRFAGPYEDSVELYGLRAAEEAAGRPLTQSEAQSYWYRRALAWWRSDPMGALKLAGKKWVLAWTHQEIRNNLAYDFVRALWAPSLRFLFVGFGLAGPLGLLGMAAAWRRGRFEQFLIGFVLIYFASFALFFAADRYRLPMAPILLMFGGYALVWAWDAIQRGNRRTIAVAAVGLIAAGAFVNVDWYRTVTPATWAQDFFSAGIRYQILGRFADAEAQERKALSLDPANAEIWSRLGESEYYQRKFSDADESFATAIRLDPENPSGYFNLALCDEASGRNDLARPLLARSAAIDPRYLPAKVELEALR
jgi:4-amino-4-deoxy-L-arabinose transferase-like glycosyltransferase